MPQLLPAAAAWAATAWTSAVTVTATALGAVGSVGALGMGGTYALAGAIVKGGVMLGLSAASAALLRPNTPSSGTTLDFKPDPKAPVRGAMGYTALGGNKVFQATWGYKRVAMSLGVALSLGPIDQVPRFEADGATVTFSGPQNEATGFYAADMWQRTTLGLPGDAALLPPTGLKYGNPGLTGWGTEHAAPQVSFSFWTMVLAKNPEDRDVFTNGVPDPRWIGRWMKLWDPRKDSTYPGGSGPQRRDDWRTWEWSESPYVHALAWCRGHYKLNLDGTIDRTKRIAGIGAPDAAIDIPAFVEGMNVAQANAWTISGEWSTSDGKFQTLLAMLQAGGGEPISRGAQISVMVNAPRVATYTYTRDDLIGQAEIRPLTPRRERKNTIVPRYKSEANGWQYVPAGEVTSSVYRDEDRGEPRSLEIEYTHVRSATQAGQLAAYDLANLREGLTATLPSKVHLMHVHPGDCITVDVPELALAGQKFVVRRATVNHQAASVTLELRSESDGKHAWALGQAAQPAPSPSLSAVDPKYVAPPAAEDWTVVPKPPGEGGVSQPIVIIELPIETTDIIAVIIKHGPSAAGPWTDGYEGSPRPDGRYEVAGLTPGQTYCFSLQYVAKNGAKSEPDIKCGIVAGDLTAGNVVPTAPTIVSIRNDIEAAFGDIFDVSELLADARTQLDAQGAEIAAARGGQSNLSARITQVNQARIDGDQANATAISGVAARTSNAEADIIDLENALASETTARAQAVSQISARLTASSLGKAVPDANASQFTGATSNSLGTEDSAPAFTTSPEQSVVVVNGETAARSAPSIGSLMMTGMRQRFRMVPGRVYEHRVDYQISGTTLETDGVMPRVRLMQENGNSHPSGNYVSGTVRLGRGRKTLKQRYCRGTPPAGVSGVAIVPADVPVVRPFLQGPLTNGVSSPSVAGYLGTVYSEEWVDVTDEATLEASVTEQSLSIIDLENQQALAAWNVVANASGGKPARIGIVSSTLGSYVALDAPYIFWGDNTVFDDATDTLQTTVGGRIRVLALGAPFGNPANLVEWWGPTGIALSAMTTTNGYNGRMEVAPYVFENAFTPKVFSAYASPASITAHRATAGSLTTAVVSILYQNAKGAVTVSWERFFGGSNGFGTAIVDSPNQLSTTFTKTVGGSERTETLFVATVTDTGTGERRQVTVPVVFTSGSV